MSDQEFFPSLPSTIKNTEWKQLNVNWQAVIFCLQIFRLSLLLVLEETCLWILISSQLVPPFVPGTESQSQTNSRLTKVTQKSCSSVSCPTDTSWSVEIARPSFRHLLAVQSGLSKHEEDHPRAWLFVTIRAWPNFVIWTVWSTHTLLVQSEEKNFSHSHYFFWAEAH